MNEKLASDIKGITSKVPSKLRNNSLISLPSGKRVNQFKIPKCHLVKYAVVISGKQQRQMQILIIYFLLCTCDFGIMAPTTPPFYYLDYTTEATLYEYDESWNEDPASSTPSLSNTLNQSNKKRDNVLIGQAIDSHKDMIQANVGKNLNEKKSSNAKLLKATVSSFSVKYVSEQHGHDTNAKSISTSKMNDFKSELVTKKKPQNQDVKTAIAAIKEETLSSISSNRNKDAPRSIFTTLTTTITPIIVPPIATNKKPSKTVFFNPNSLPTGGALKNLLKNNPILANFIPKSVAISTTRKPPVTPELIISTLPKTTTSITVPPIATNKKPSKTVFFNPNSLPTGGALKDLLKNNPILANFIPKSVAISTTRKPPVTPELIISTLPKTTTPITVPPIATNKKPSKTVFFNPNSLPTGGALKDLLKNNPILANFIPKSVAISTTRKPSVTPELIVSTLPKTTTPITVPPIATNKKPSKTVFFNPNSLPTGGALKDLLKNNPILANFIPKSVAISTTRKPSVTPELIISTLPKTTTPITVPPIATNKKPSKTVFFNPNSLPTGGALKDLLKNNPILANFIPKSVAISTTRKPSVTPELIISTLPKTTTPITVPPIATNKKPSKTVFFNPNSLPTGGALKDLLKNNPILANFIPKSVAISTTRKPSVTPELIISTLPKTTTPITVPPIATNKKPSKTVFFNPNSLPTGGALKDLLKNNPILANFIPKVSVAITIKNSYSSSLNAKNENSLAPRNKFGKKTLNSKMKETHNTKLKESKSKFVCKKRPRIENNFDV